MFRKLSLSVLLIVTILSTLDAAPQNKPGSKAASLEAVTDDGRVVLLKEDGTWTFTGRKRSTLSSSGKSNGAPSQAEVQTCIDSSQDDSIKGGPLEQLQFGAPTTSQGGMMDVVRGAAKGTTIFSAKYILRSTSGSPFEGTIWMFMDSFGKWRCARAN
jgi:hypothetical protein